MDPVNSDDVTRRLVDEGAKLLARYGPDGLSLRQVAAAAGTSTMAVYTRFGDKKGLLAAMHREGFRRLGERLLQGSDTAEPLLALARAYRTSALDSPHLYRLMFGPQPQGFEVSEGDDKAAGATYTPLVDGVRAAVAAGLLTGDPERIALHLWAVAHGMMSLELSGQLPVSAQHAGRVYDQAMYFAAQPFLPATTPRSRT